MVVGGGGGWCKPIIRHNSNSTLGGVELTWSGDGVEMELGVELELDNIAFVSESHCLKDKNIKIPENS